MLKVNSCTIIVVHTAFCGICENNTADKYKIQVEKISMLLYAIYREVDQIRINPNPVCEAHHNAKECAISYNIY